MDFRGFIVALLSEWISLMSGVASLLLSWLSWRFKWRAIPPRIFLLTAVICFGIAMVRIWTVEHREKVRLANELADRYRPDFEIELFQGLLAPYIAADTTFTSLNVIIINRGYESGVTSWAVRYKSPTVDMPVRIVRLTGGKMEGVSESKQHVMLHEADNIVDLSVKAIQRGHILRGRLYLEIPGRESAQELALGKALLFVSVKDYLGKEYTEVFKGGEKASEFYYFPGETHTP